MGEGPGPFDSKHTPGCVHGDHAACTCACPFGVDVRQLIDKIQKRSFDAAFKIYRNAVAFPEIVSAICPAPCGGACVLGDKGLNIKLLERASIDHARNIDPIKFNLPDKEERIAIIGAGLCGLACALRFASKKYKVDVYEKSGAIGGKLAGSVPEELYMGDIERQFKYDKYELHLNTEIKSLDEIEADAILIATDGDDFGVCGSVNETTYQTADPDVFAAGGILGHEGIWAIVDGLQVAQSIEIYLRAHKTFNMMPEKLQLSTRLKYDASGANPEPQVVPAADGRYSKDEAVTEAKRCLQCDCDECMHCEFMKRYRAAPKQLESRFSNAFQEWSYTPATENRLTSSCSECGLCTAVCKYGVDLNQMMQHAKYEQVKRKQMPPAYHDYWVRDMQFTNDEIRFTAPPPGGGKAKYAYFPGCQMPASNPRWAVESYKWLLSIEKDTAYIGLCCGAPARWAGDEELEKTAYGAIVSAWESFGKPVMVFACPTCRRLLSDAMPEMESVTIYELMAEAGARPAARIDGNRCVFDACSARHDDRTQESVRKLAAAAGAELTELPQSGEKANCCGFGGNIAVANARLYEKIKEVNTAQSPDPYIVYCANCHDAFASKGKDVAHVFDLYFDTGAAGREQPKLYERRLNRAAAVQAVKKEVFGMPENAPEKGPKLIVSGELREKLEARYILDSDIMRVIEQCERTGRKVIDEDAGTSIGHLEIGAFTYWVEYRAVEGGYELLNAYGHRMQLADWTEERRNQNG